MSCLCEDSQENISGKQISTAEKTYQDSSINLDVVITVVASLNAARGCSKLITRAVVVVEIDKEVIRSES